MYIFFYIYKLHDLFYKNLQNIIEFCYGYFYIIISNINKIWKEIKKMNYQPKIWSINMGHNKIKKKYGNKTKYGPKKRKEIL